MNDECRREVHELHAFFQGWFTGELPDTDAAFARLASVIAPEFQIVSPSGRGMHRAELLESLRATHGADPGARIRVADFRGREVGEDLFLATYEEWQARPTGEKGRLSSVLFGREQGAPNGVAWLHLHECWLP